MLLVAREKKELFYISTLGQGLPTRAIDLSCEDDVDCGINPKGSMDFPVADWGT